MVKKNKCSSILSFSIKFCVCIFTIIIFYPKFLYAVDVMNVAELRQEIMDINDGQQDNVINLAAPMFIVMDEDPVEQNNNAFPEITSEMTIKKDSSIDDDVKIIRDSADDFRFFNINNGGDLTLKNVILDNGNVNDFGGAIQVRNNSELTLEEVTIINCNAADDGGAIDIVTSKARIEDSIIGMIGMGNETEDNGGGINIADLSPVEIRDTLIAGNIAHNGGGISNFNIVDVIIEDSIIDGNTANINNGGGIYHIQGNLEIEDSTITNNNAQNTGGGIYNGANLSVEDTTIAMNEANAGGGIFNESSLTVLKSTIGPANTSGGGGGGGLVNNFNRNMVLRNTTVSSNNSQGPGGGIENFGNLTLNNVTIGFNEANTDGGGIWNFGVDINFTNTLIGQNMAVVNGDDCFSNLTITTDNSNLIEKQANFCLLDGPAITGLSPQLGTLADNGNPKDTFTNAIPMMSPAFNNGNNNSCESQDQRGLNRPQGESCDIGAYELFVQDGGGGGEFSPGDANGDGIINGLDITATVNAVLEINMASGNADCNEDGTVNGLDITCVVNKVLEI